MRINGYQCDVCAKIEPIREVDQLRHSRAFDAPPLRWLALGVDIDKDALHFCSLVCLHDWVEKQLDVPEVARPFHSSEIRRFLLVDKGPNADFTEGVKWPSGYVSVDPEKTKMHEPWCYTGWEEFKQAYPDRTVHWIDIEDKPS